MRDCYVVILLICYLFLVSFLLCGWRDRADVCAGSASCLSLVPHSVHKNSGELQI